MTLGFRTIGNMKKKVKEVKYGDLVRCWAGYPGETIGRVIGSRDFGQGIIYNIIEPDGSRNTCSNYECVPIKKALKDIPMRLWFVDEARSLGWPIIHDNGRAFLPIKDGNGNNQEIINRESKQK